MDAVRLKLLEQYVKEEPEDPFNWYALALEESKKNSDKAIELFEYVLKNHPEYLPAYYHAGNLYLAVGDTDRAKTILQKGVDLAKLTGEQKAMRELKALLDDLIS